MRLQQTGMAVIVGRVMLNCLFASMLSIICQSFQQKIAISMIRISNLHARAEYSMAKIKVNRNNWGFHALGMILGFIDKGKCFNE